jgi:hypothetical protein
MQNEKAIICDEMLTTLSSHGLEKMRPLMVIWLLLSHQCWAIHTLNSFLQSVPQKKVTLGNLGLDASTQLIAQYGYRDTDDQKYSYRQAKNPDNDQERSQRLIALLRQTDSVVTGMLFFCLLWRILAIYEMLGSSNNTIINVLMRSSVLLLFALNTLGLVLNFLKGRVRNLKNILKCILVINILREWIEASYNIVMMIMDPAERPLFQGRLIMNLWWSILCLRFARSRWVENVTMPSTFKKFLQSDL